MGKNASSNSRLGHSRPVRSCSVRSRNSASRDLLSPSPALSVRKLRSFNSDVLSPAPSSLTGRKSRSTEGPSPRNSPTPPPIIKIEEQDAQTLTPCQTQDRLPEDTAHDYTSRHTILGISPSSQQEPRPTVTPRRPIVRYPEDLPPATSESICSIYLRHLSNLLLQIEEVSNSLKEATTMDEQRLRLEIINSHQARVASMSELLAHFLPPQPRLQDPDLAEYANLLRIHWKSPPQERVIL
ncbi:hypothetical protein BGX26_007316, partial [Mortierella sp. AD094]